MFGRIGILGSKSSSSSNMADFADENMEALGQELVIACQDGMLDHARALLDQGVDIEVRNDNDDSFTPLMCASNNGHTEVCVLLLDRGASINAVDTLCGYSALSVASKSGHRAIVELLEARGANVQHKDDEGRSPLLWAAIYDSLPVCIHLLSKGADLMTVDNVGRTALSAYGDSTTFALSQEAKKDRQIALFSASNAYLLATRDSTIAALCSENAILKRPAHTCASILFSEQFSDVVFLCPDGERIHGHRCIVAACSPHMERMLEGDWAEHAGEVTMLQPAAAVRALLRFFYTGEVDETALLAQMSDVLHLAAQHEQSGLKAACEKCAADALSVQAVVPILVAAHLHDLPALKARCVDFVTESVPNAAAVVSSKAYMKLKTTHPLLWRELRVALGLPEEEEEEDDEGEEGGNAK